MDTRDEIEAITRAREIKERMGREAREKAGGCEAEIESYLAAMRRSRLAASTLETRGYVLRGFVDALGVRSPAAVSAAAVQRWFDGRFAEHPHTAVAYLAVIHYWLAWLVERGRLAVDVTAAVKRPKLPMQQRRNFLLPAQVRQLLDGCTAPDETGRVKTNLGLKFAIYCGAHAGLRKDEVIEARPEWFDLDAGLIHVQATPTFEPKGRDNRTIPLTDEFKTWLKEVYGLPSPYMLVAQKTVAKRPNTKGSAYRYDFRSAFENLRDRCGIEVTFHDLRRTFASLLVSKGVSLYKVAKWLGDTTEVVEGTYGHLIPQDDQINEAWK